MIKTVVVQKDTYTCDKCGTSKTVETVLEECYDEYSLTNTELPKGFFEIKEINKIVCKECKKDLENWLETKK